MQVKPETRHRGHQPKKKWAWVGFIAIAIIGLIIAAPTAWATDVTQGKTIAAKATQETGTQLAALGTIKDNSDTATLTNAAALLVQNTNGKIEVLGQFQLTGTTLSTGADLGLTTIDANQYRILMLQQNGQQLRGATTTLTNLLTTLRSDQALLDQYQGVLLIRKEAGGKSLSIAQLSVVGKIDLATSLAANIGSTGGVATTNQSNPGLAQNGLGIMLLENVGQISTIDLKRLLGDQTQMASIIASSKTLRL
ncbi:MAG: hypothetical protein AABX70_08360 [Nanoarchaeota archaeon]